MQKSGIMEKERTMMAEDFRRCTRCILPDSHPTISFNDQGICNFCLEPIAERENYTELKKQLDKIIKSYKGKGRYDVILGLSGGKDSTYVAYYLKKEYNLKILGFNFDNGYRSEIAIRNLSALVDNLGIDLVTVRPNQAFMKRLYGHFLKKQGEFCSVCNNLGYVYMASFCCDQKKTLGYSPLTVGGWSRIYEYQPGVSVTSLQYFFQNLNRELEEELMSQVTLDANVIRTYKRLRDPRQVKIGSKDYEENKEYLIDLIQLPDYVEWDLMRIPQILKKELGWEQPSGKHDSHFDCSLFPIKEFLKYKKFGLTQETIKNSTLIRRGVMTRNEALQRMALEQRTEPDRYQDFIDELGLHRSEINDRAEWSRE